MPQGIATAERGEGSGMEHGFESTLVSAIDLRMPGLRLRSFALHRPAASRVVLEGHPRCWSKAVLFLEGSGEPGVRVEPGTVLLLPPGAKSPGETAGERLPACLAFDFCLAGRAARAALACVLPRAELFQAREQLAYLLRLQNERAAPRKWESGLVSLNLLITVLRAAGWLGPAAAVVAEGGSAMHRLLLAMPLESPLEQVVQRSGYQRDHLNRLIKKETGLTLGQFRAQRRLRRAKEMLARGVKVGDVAGEIGLPDQSYFARWFRRQTGHSPSRWLEAGGEPPSLELARCG